MWTSLMSLPPRFPLPQVLWQDLPQIRKSHKTSEDTHRGTAVQVGATVLETEGFSLPASIGP